MSQMTSPAGATMLSHLPSYYSSSRVMRTVLQAQGRELDRLKTALDGVLNQTFVSRATWGLDRWEVELGFAERPAADVTERRQRILGRLRGTGTATLSIVRHIAKSYDNGRVAVIEDYPSYRLVVRFIDTHGVPPNLDDLKAALRSVVPAHLEITYEHTYMIWSQLDEKQHTWETFDALALAWGALEVYS